MGNALRRHTSDSPFDRNKQRLMDTLTAALCEGLDRPVPVDVEARLMEHGVTLKAIRQSYVD